MGDLEDKAGIVKGLTDVFPETANQADKALSMTIRAINAALVTIKPAIWGFERIGEWLDKKLPEKLKNVPEENIITPPINIAGPAIEAMRFTGEGDELREMYANLLASSMNKELTLQAHPRFVEIIKNLSSDEAKLLSIFSKNGLLELEIFSHSILTHRKDKYYSYNYLEKSFRNFINITDDQINISLDNLSHLGIVSMDIDSFYENDLVDGNKILGYPFLHTTLRAKLNVIRNRDCFESHKIYTGTMFGNKFVDLVVKS